MRSFLLVCVAAAMSHVWSSARADPAENASRFMSNLCAAWAGEGVADGVRVTDLISARRGADPATLVTESRATSGDSFVASSTLTYQREADSFVAVETNNGKWPLRRLTGKLRGNTLELTEREPSRHVVLALQLVDSETLEVTESMVESGRVQAPFVRLTYKRDASKGRCAP